MNYPISLTADDFYRVRQSCAAPRLTQGHIHTLADLVLFLGLDEDRIAGLVKLGILDHITPEEWAAHVEKGVE